MKVIQYDAPNNPVWREMPTPEPQAGQLLVKILGVTTCPHWDIHIMAGEPMFPWGDSLAYPHPPGQPGHEATGEVAVVGEDVTGFESGIRVVAWRDQGHGRPGCYGEYAIMEAENVLQIPNWASERIASLELAMCVQVSFDKFIQYNLIQDKRLGISGLGPAGLIAVQMAKAHGASEVVGIDPIAERRELAAMLGADIVLSPDELPEGRFNKTSLDTAIDCTGLKVSIEFLMARTREAVSIFGVLREEVAFGPQHRGKEFMLMGYGEHNKEAAKRALDLVLKGEVNLSPLVTHTLPMREYKQGVELLQNKEAIKVCFDPWRG